MHLRRPDVAIDDEPAREVRIDYVSVVEGLQEGLARHLEELFGYVVQAGRVGQQQVGMLIQHRSRVTQANVQIIALLDHPAREFQHGFRMFGLLRTGNRDPVSPLLGLFEHRERVRRRRPLTIGRFHEPRRPGQPGHVHRDLSCPEADAGLALLGRRRGLVDVKVIVGPLHYV